MNNDLRNAVSHICEKLKSRTGFTSAAEINHLSNQLKKFTGHLQTVSDHELFMEFFSLVARHQDRFLSSSNQYSSEFAISDETQLLIKTCRELLVLLDVRNAEKVRKDFLLYANGIINKLDMVANLIALVSWKSEAEKIIFLHESIAIFEKFQAEGWRCEGGHVYGLIPANDGVDYEMKFQIFLNSLRSDKKTNDKYFKKPFDSMQNIVVKLESLQKKAKLSNQESHLICQSLSVHGLFGQKRRASHSHPAPAYVPPVKLLKTF
jgi:hypothetical protein